jgi:hypothetical protein
VENWIFGYTYGIRAVTKQMHSSEILSQNLSRQLSSKAAESSKQQQQHIQLLWWIGQCWIACDRTRTQAKNQETDKSLMWTFYLSGSQQNPHQNSHKEKARKKQNTKAQAQE